MTHFTAPDSSGRMGRPPLGNKSTNVRISDEVKERIRQLVGDKGMARFIREAIEAELDRREQAANLKKR
ncbi:hypothetical protein [Tardiphaga sp.]|uniref:hypothetical protein n=1 Tax=Tardiphaga sp. TaxID=1926292 RepID=UPI00262244D6|nr:hypothetical protein [Tardiphaga sp.]